MIKAVHFEIEEEFAIYNYAAINIHNCQLLQNYIIFLL